MKKVIVVGNATHDLIFLTQGTLKTHDVNECELFEETGGSMHNVAYNSAKLGLNVSFLTKLGNDDRAKRIAKELVGVGVTLNPIYVDYETPVTTKILADDINLSFSTQTQNYELHRNDFSNFDAYEDCEYGVTDSNNSAFILELCDELPDTKWIVTGVLPDLYIANRLEGLIISRADIRNAVGDKPAMQAVQELIDAGIQWVIVTMGASGSNYISKEDSLLVEAIKSEYHFTYGAGDSYTAGLLYGLCNDKEIHESLKLATRAGYLACQDHSALNDNILRINDFYNENENNTK